MSNTNRLDAIEARHSAWYSGDDTTAEWPDPIDFVVGYENDKDSTPRKRAMAHEITREDIPYLLELARKQQVQLNPEYTELALKHLISDLDYDVYKELEEDDSFPSFTRNFIRYYEAVAAL